jgi:oligopeptide/dipeptide ABC transporter ATP-binding protein
MDTNTKKTHSELLEVKNLKKYYVSKSGLFKKNYVKAVDDVSFSIKSGKTLSIVGESGCGKSTTGRAVLNLERPTAGQVIFEGQDILGIDNESLRNLRKDMQLVFQDPYSSLNSRMKIKDILAEPFEIHDLYQGKGIINQVKQLLELVGLPEKSLNKYPHEFSGGQRQRIVIARAIALRPKLIVCDEPVSALDVSVQSQIVNLFIKLQKELGLTYLFISHDLSIVRYISDQVGVMYLGRMVEYGEKSDVFSNPLHPYTKALMSSIPLPNPKIQRNRERIVLHGDVPSPMNIPTGCHFHTRCPFVKEECKNEVPEWREIKPDHWVSCHFADSEYME